MRKIVTLLLLPLSFFSGSPSPGLALTAPPTAARLTCLAVSPVTPNELWAASEHEFFRREPDASWKSLGQVQTGGDPIRQFVPQTPQEFFILTGRAIFRFDLRQNHLEKIFDRNAEAGTSVFSFAVWNQPQPVWAAGTDAGLFISSDTGKTWAHYSLLPGSDPVTLAASAEKNLFVVSNHTLYRAESMNRVNPVFILPVRSSGTDENDEALSSAPGDAESFELFRPHLVYSAKDPGRLWLSTEDGVAESRDGGRRWKMLPLSGLENSTVQSLAYAEKTGILFAGTASGVYAYLPRARRWRAFSAGGSPAAAEGLAVTQEKEEKLMAVAEGRIFEQSIPPEILSAHLWIASPEKEKRLEMLARIEPTMREVHRAVMRFGNLSNDKIRRWHRESRLRAFFPSVSVSPYVSKHNTIDLDRGGTADPDRYILGPQSVATSWDVNVGWSLSDMIWDTAQTSIDTREKLMVDQRRDFLAEATRIYYERRRLQAEILFSDPESKEVPVSYERQIRLEELTAQIDALTGGWFSTELEKAEEEHPELRELWRRSSLVASRP